jgi:REP element-mobilizing transposase RayT
MGYRPDRHHRRSIRLAGYDYAAGGAYFVTICTAGKECLFGKVIDGRIALSSFGEIVWEEWHGSANVRRELELGPFVVMPNHVHGIVTIVGDGHVVGATGGRPRVGAPSESRASAARPYGPSQRSVGSFVAGFKSAVTRRVNALRQTPSAPIWQRNYYEHIVRDEDDYFRIAEYIENNPRGWPEDDYYVS